MSRTVQPVCRIIAGPNGAGKTTFALKYLPALAAGSAFINADLIAAGLSPLAPEQQQLAASRLFLYAIERSIQVGQDFSIETTLSGRGYLRLIQRLQTQGWRVELFYLALPTVEMSLLRVAERVAHGGHSIQRNLIERRFPRRLHNLFYVYGEAVDYVRCFLNSGEIPQLVFIQQGKTRTVLLSEPFDQLLHEATR